MIKHISLFEGVTPDFARVKTDDHFGRVHGQKACNYGHVALRQDSAGLV